MQAKIYEFLTSSGNEEKTKLFVTKDSKNIPFIADVCKYLGYETFMFPNIKVGFAEDLRAYKNEFDELFSQLNRFYKNKKSKKIIISPFATLLHPLPKKELFKEITVEFAGVLDTKLLKDRLFYWGYDFVDIVQEKGEVSFRGDIVDIYPVTLDKPVRISLFDDEVESIRYFESETQKSIKDELESVKIPPANFSLTKESYEKIREKIQNLKSDSFERDMKSLGFWALDDLSEYFSKKITSYLCEDISKEYEEFKSFYPDIYDIQKECFTIKPSEKYKNIEVIDINSLLDFHQNKKIKILAKNDALIKNSLLDEKYKKFVIKNDNIVNIASKDEIIISLNKRVSLKRRKISKIVLDELRNGDYVVHDEYGIGKFTGIENITVLGAKRDFISIIYQNNDKLLLPVENINKIDRYISDSGTLAVLDKLGKGSFAKLKSKVKEKLFEIARELVEIAALRELEKGVKIDTTLPEIKIFQNSAGFTYTLDQEKTINEIFSDLSSGKIMDRLLSGDVGFGKTEVAMNAIFCTVKNGFQALFVAPTTLLANQHYSTLKERFEKFGINVYRLDRFVGTKEKKDTLKGLEDGKISVCVGTHALFNAKFKNLALLVIDEEHKFGVKQKEKLKNFKKDVHILSMSATPIPRSLNMALSSIKQYSQILTAPLEKKGVRTFVKEFDKQTLKEIILRERRRGGQIFFIHNRIATIEERKKYLKEILPNLKILILHSEINSSQIEKEMLEFENGKYDLLLSTSIVESGLHMPRVNSMIIENADRFGIADLHQLRGRVGRGKHEGYCYLLVQNKETLSEISKKRLIALESNSFLGSGSVLAYHDLQIRGGGNLIGKAQSGHIKNIGYTQYLKLLEESINELLNKKVIKKKEVNLKLNISAYINEEYISEDRLRLDIYRRLGLCEELSEVYDIEEELYDRFGEIDNTTKQFLDLIAIKIKAVKAGIVQVSNYQQNITFIYEDGNKKEFKANSKDDDDIIEAVLKNLIQD